MHSFFSRFLTPYFGERLISFVGIIIILYLLRDFMMIFLLTFFFAYLFYSVVEWSQNRLTHFEKKSTKSAGKFIHWLAQEKVILIILYVVFAGIVAIIIRDIGPTLIGDLISFLKILSERYQINVGTSDLTETLEHWKIISYQFGDVIKILSPSTDATMIIQELLRVGNIFFQILLAYVLSFVWLLEYEKAHAYFNQLKRGPFAFFFRDVQGIIGKVQRSFGLVFHAQSKIAVINTILTIFGLVIIGILYGNWQDGYLFPYLWALGCITFLTSFVPILGVFIGGIPIVLAGILEYSGWGIVVAIVAMLTIIHIIEGYFLNPRIVGHSVNLPVPLVFLILLLAEHFMGVAGFFLGVPMYLLIVELLESAGRMMETIKKQKGV